jgi:GNAT superfamily N-acetyltransferase
VPDLRVRPADPADSGSVAAVQAGAWRAAYAELLPAEVLAGLASADAVETWRAAITAPPTPRHRVLVATEDAAVVGFAAMGPATDADLSSADAELFEVCVEPAHRGHGHGSRLLNASVDALRSDGFGRAHAWLPSGEPAPGRRFLEAGGWADSGARRALDLAGDGAVVVHQLRLHTSIVADE